MNKQIILKIKALAFDKQLQVLKAIMKGKRKRVAIHVGRRGAKTSTIVILYMIFGLMYKNIRLLFISLSGQNAEDAFYPHFKEYCNKVNLIEGIDYTFNNTERLITFISTGSTISLKGNDTSYKEAPKILGGKCFWVHYDELNNQTQDIEKAILYYVQAAVSDYLPIGGGGISLSGTSGDYQGSNFWYRICTSTDHLGWEYFTWIDKQNPHMLPAKLIEDQQFTEQYGKDFQQLDWYRQQYLNEWITSQNRLVYKLTNKNLLGHPDCPHPRPTAEFLASATYGLGMDWGFSPDPMAFLVACFNLKFSNKLYFIKEHKQTEMFVPDIHQYITQLNLKYHFQFMVADAGALAKQSVQDLNVNYQWSILPADKLGKLAHQNTLNGDLNNESILIDQEACPGLINEMTHLIWDPIKLNTENKRVEKEGLPNHLSDCMTYLHFHCRHQWYQSPKPKFIPANSQEAAKHFSNELMKQMINRNRPRLWQDINFAAPNIKQKGNLK